MQIGSGRKMKMVEIYNGDTMEITIKEYTDLMLYNKIITIVCLILILIIIGLFIYFILGKVLKYD